MIQAFTVIKKFNHIQAFIARLLNQSNQKLGYEYLTLCMQGNFSSFSCRLPTFFKITFFQKILSGTVSGCQMVLIQIRTDILSVLIWVQTVLTGYWQMTKVATYKERVKSICSKKKIFNCFENMSFIMIRWGKYPIDLKAYLELWFIIGVQTDFKKVLLYPKVILKIVMCFCHFASSWIKFWNYNLH